MALSAFTSIFFMNLLEQYIFLYISTINIDLMTLEVEINAQIHHVLPWPCLGKQTSDCQNPTRFREELEVYPPYHGNLCLFISIYFLCKLISTSLYLSQFPRAQKEGGKNFALTNKKKRKIELLKRRIERRLTKVTRWEAERLARQQLIQNTIDKLREEKAPKSTPSGRGRKKAVPAPSASSYTQPYMASSSI